MKVTSNELKQIVIKSIQNFVKNETNANESENRKPTKEKRH